MSAAAFGIWSSAFTARFEILQVELYTDDSNDRVWDVGGPAAWLTTWTAVMCYNIMSMGMPQKATGEGAG